MNTETRQSKRWRCPVLPSDPSYDAVVLERIKSLIAVDPVTGCWLWQGPIATVKWNARGFYTGGYGCGPGYRGRGIAVHRTVWMIHNGPQPKKMDVCHTCDVRHCCNPAHLWLGTRSQNLQDMADKGRGPCGGKAAQTHCVRGHELSGDNLMLSNGGRRRGCKTCMGEVHHQTDAYKRWRLAYQRIRRGWSKEDAWSMPPVASGTMTPRRVIGVRNRGRAA